jgi:hypothetical protein
MAKKHLEKSVLRILDESGTHFRRKGKSTSERNLKGYPAPQKKLPVFFRIVLKLNSFHQL